MTYTDPEAREAMRAQIVETLGEHRLVDYGECSCGWAPTSYRLGDDRALIHRRAHLADVLLGLWDGDES